MAAMLRRSCALLLLSACNPGGDTRALEAMLEIKGEVATALADLRHARGALDEARADFERARADLERARLALDAAGAGATRAPREPDDSPDPLEAPANLLEPELAAGLTCDDAGACTLKHTTLALMLADPAALARQARVVPAFKDGEPQGFKVFGVRPGSLPRLLGLKNGDLISAVNGAPLRSIDDAMRVISELRRARQFTLTGERKGEPLKVSLTITDD